MNDSGKRRPRLLFVCMNNPWPLNNGAVIRNSWVVRGMAKHFDIDTLTSDPVDPKTIPPEYAAANDLIEGYPRPLGRAGQLFRLRGALAPNASFYTSGVVTGALAKRTRELVRERGYAGVIVDLKAWPAMRGIDAPMIYHAHNCEWKLLERRAQTEPGLRGKLVAFDARRVKAIEREILERAHTSIVLSEEDLDDLSELAPSTRSKYVLATNGVDVSRFDATRDTPTDGRTVLLTGSFDWRPNQQGVEWFAERVLPELRRVRPDVDVRVAGRMNDAFAKTIASWGVTPVPNPPHMEPELARAHVIAAPILASSGTRLRILEAWAAGRPLVTTLAGAFGLPHEDGRELYARDEPVDFVRAIDELFASPERWTHVRDAALARVRDFDWPGIGERLGNAMAERFPA